MAARYAVYYAPRADEALAGFARDWLGYDPETGMPVRFAMVEGMAPDLHLRAVTEPRRYGFHGTLKAPFHLAPGVTERDLLRGATSFAQRHAPFALSLRLGAIGGFLALIPVDGAPAVNRLAADCVQEFDRFRAPPDAETLARRRTARLTARQEMYLARWGYPYVLDEFRFHLTLTGKLETPAREHVSAILAPLVVPLCAGLISVRDIAIFVQPEPAAPFRVLDRFPLKAPP